MKNTRKGVFHLHIYLFTVLSNLGQKLNPLKIMEIKIPTGRIKIVRIPRGEAPEEHRIAWVGLVLPCEPLLFVVQGQKRDHTYNFLVPQILGVQELAKTKPAAAAWFYRHCEFNNGDNLCFQEDEAEILDGSVRRHVITEGDFER